MKRYEWDMKALAWCVTGLFGIDAERKRGVQVCLFLPCALHHIDFGCDVAERMRVGGDSLGALLVGA